VLGANPASEPRQRRTTLLGLEGGGSQGRPRAPKAGVNALTVGPLKEHKTRPDAIGAAAAIISQLIRWA
jgi:hypothetical protein